MNQAKSMVFHGYNSLGLVDVRCDSGPEFRFPKNEIRIDHLSPAGRANSPPLAILQAIAPSAVKCGLQFSDPVSQDLITLHNFCLDQFKTAVVVLGDDEEIHLVAMRSRLRDNLPCFWCFSTPSGLYDSCLKMFIDRSLGIVFDLDETLIAANHLKRLRETMKILEVSIKNQLDPAKKREKELELLEIQRDKLLLEQYSENDEVSFNGELLKASLEEVPGYRPIIRIPSSNIVLTRIDTARRDTSVIIRIRPGWEALRNHLTSITARRFEVFVCTKSERAYALEMWRLLDPESHLISLKDHRNRIVCVPGERRKSLSAVFEGASCLPKLAMIVDDRADVWEVNDKPRVSPVAPYLAFAPTVTPVLDESLSQAKEVTRKFRAYFYKQVSFYSCF